MTRDLGSALRDLGADLPELDFTERAWAEAGRRRSRRRRLASGVVMGALAAALAVGAGHALGSRDAALPARPGPDATEYSPAHVLVDGTYVDQAPLPDAEAGLPRLPGIGDVSLPERLGFTATASLPPLSQVGGIAEPVRAVLLRALGDGTYHAVLYVPGRPGGTYVEVDTVALEPLTHADGSSAGHLGARTITDDRHGIALVQPGKILTLDARDGSLRTWPVADHLLSGGWARDNVTVIASGATQLWSIDTATGGPARRLTGLALPGRAALVTDPSGTPVLRSARADGTLWDERTVPALATTWGQDTVSNLEGWSASAALFPTSVRAVASGYQGLYAVQFDVVAHARLLAASDVAGVPRGSLVARGWAPQDVLLYTSTSGVTADGAGTTSLLAWSVIDGRMWRVGDVGPVSSGPGGFTGVFALSP